MKKIIALMIVAVLLFACKSTSVTSTKLDRSSQVSIKGNWVITNITTPGSNYIAINSFQIADSKCFIGSTWNFISNNNKGSMNLTKSDCPAFSSPIVWSVNKESQFVLKILDAGEKAKKVRDGYVLRLANQTETSFQLIDNVNIAGQNKEVIYQFEKTN
ncbi:MAG: lipocalin family protein [Flavobacterium sp.]|nr:lipocalin family protein [Flavobacterium sp.]MBP6587163.1 lipocalin family protein [Flavobacterium sp.]MBP7470333.1 lipocalin family protein [Flavobacterium sp.]